MSEDSFHVHGPHDHELEHAAGSHGNSFTNKIAMFTAIIALLTRKTWVEYAMFGAGGLGAGVGILAALHI